jgi:hypothetical protein
MGTIMNQLGTGRLLLVGAGSEPPRMLALDGAKPALEAFSRCIVAMNLPAQPISTPEAH